jgi:uncharacterized coiled-coil protein SlyX
VAELAALLDQSNAYAAAKENRIGELSLDVSARDARIRELTKLLGEASEIVAATEGRVNTILSEVAVRDTKIVDLAAQIAELRVALDRARANRQLLLSKALKLKADLDRALSDAAENRSRVEALARSIKFLR